ncbi:MULTISPECIES: hypothetical protein [Salinibacter]|jgi:hypothetical protein|uniref:CopG family transcriptional regulator n=1 Tax=Salinibacter ruber TaxID=146919 RepID=A0A840DEQ8_9BACT|nr:MULTISPECIES: hypothetical protein [Salinibacter]MBB4062796.1 hypothetical protein [Salinibacter ruber]MBB4070285.1 hypothetical protein [Salinibacter ruber]MBB4090952.1 hypothetical protein [Salinibacter ruber]MCS3616709.1 hypothetical protein [Salinibacter ruber]MCS3628525.1 hypothetical protein [Salinibacter ruber]
MSKDKPDIDFDDSDAGFSEEEDEERRRRSEGTKKQFNTLIRPGLEERLNAAAFWTDRSKADILDEALRFWLDQAEEERDEAFEILPPHEVDSS